MLHKLANESFFFDAFSAGVIVFDKNTNFEERRLYLPDTTVAAQPHEVRTELTDVCIGGTSFTLDLVPALLIDPDLHTTYPKPYTLDLN